MALSEWEREFLALADGRVKHYPNVREALGKSEISHKAAEAYARSQIIAPDDSIPPTAPVVVVVPLYRGLLVSWVAPPPEEGVDYTEIVYTRVQDGSTGTVVTRSDRANIPDLVPHMPDAIPAAPSEYHLTLRHFDVYGLESDPETVTGARPLSNKADELDLAIVGKIRTGGGIIVGEVADPRLLFDNDGITLKHTGTDAALYASSVQRNLMIKSKPGQSTQGAPSDNLKSWAGIGLFDDPVDPEPNERGWVIEAEGIKNGSKRGVVVLRATKNVLVGADDAVTENQRVSTSRIALRSGTSNTERGVIQVKGELVFQDSTETMSQGTNWTHTDSPGPNLPALKVTRVGNVCYLEGIVKNNSGSNNGDGARICTLSDRFKPSVFRRTLASGSTGASDPRVWTKRVNLVIESGGDIHLAAAGAGDNVIEPGNSLSLDGVCYTL
jgi:hypothetical protein